MIQFVVIALVLVGVSWLVVAVTVEQEAGPKLPLRWRLEELARSVWSGTVRTWTEGSRQVVATGRGLRKRREAERHSEISGDGKLRRDGQATVEAFREIQPLEETRPFAEPQPFRGPAPVTRPRPHRGRTFPELLPYRGRHRTHQRFGQTLEVTAGGGAPSRSGLFSQQSLPVRRTSRSRSFLRLLLMMLLIGLAVGLVLAALAMGIKGLAG